MVSILFIVKLCYTYKLYNMDYIFMMVFLPNKDKVKFSYSAISSA